LAFDNRFKYIHMYLLPLILLLHSNFDLQFTDEYIAIIVSI